MSGLAAVGALIPISVAAAISTVPLLAMIALLLSGKKRGSALAYLLGWTVGLFIVAAGFSLGLSAASPSRSAVTVPLLGAAETVIGVVLVAFGVVVIARKTKPATSPGWTDKLTGIGWVPAAALGVILNFRPKALLLAAAAGIAISAPQPTVGEGVIGLAIYTAISCSSVAVPVILTLARPATMEPRLRQARGWLQRNQRIITGVVVIMVGVVIVGNGLTHMAG
ncbi:GAP family protein [Herbiconiux sp. UC225_62]|uniref:GAP family protein n=1 Tax=Herbiconiux sp. UC225_62 TaxID=3350168 RepID=UPI0036D41674